MEGGREGGRADGRSSGGGKERRKSEKMKGETDEHLQNPKKYNSTTCSHYSVYQCKKTIANPQNSLKEQTDVKTIQTNKRQNPQNSLKEQLQNQLTLSSLSTELPPVGVWNLICGCCWSSGVRELIQT